MERNFYNNQKMIKNSSKKCIKKMMRIILMKLGVMILISLISHYKIKLGILCKELKKWKKKNEN